MKQRLLFSGLLFALLFGGTILQCQQLTVETDSGKQVLSRANLEGLAHVKVTVPEHSSGTTHVSCIYKEQLVDWRNGICRQLLGRCPAV
jgi:hypothetical protein